MAAAARLLRLDADRTASAFGIAYAEAAGEMQMYEESADTVALQQGFRARAGVTAAYLAQAGLAGPHSPLLGRYGFFKVFEPNHDLSALLDGLGSDFVGSRLSFKPYPCCKCIHPALDAILHLVKTAGIARQTVAELRIGTNRLSRDFVAEPRAVRWAPRTGVEARFSLPYVAAVAVANGAVHLEDFAPEALDQAAVKRILAVTEVTVDEAIERVAGHAANAPASIVIRLSDGRSLSHRVDKPKGHPDNPAGFSDGVDKLRACGKFGDGAILLEQIDHLVASIHNLDRAPDLSTLLSALPTTDPTGMKQHP